MAKKMKLPSKLLSKIRKVKMTKKRRRRKKMGRPKTTRRQNRYNVSTDRIGRHLTLKRYETRLECLVCGKKTKWMKQTDYNDYLKMDIRPCKCGDNGRWKAISRDIKTKVKIFDNEEAKDE